MSNSLNMELEGKHVLIRKEDLKPEYHDIAKRVFLVEGGFGMHNFTIGVALFGKFISDGEKCRMEGYDVERLATDQEIKEASNIKKEIKNE